MLANGRWDLTRPLKGKIFHLQHYARLCYKTSVAVSSTVRARPNCSLSDTNTVNRVTLFLGRT
jgi:hypothetical protein